MGETLSPVRVAVLGGGFSGAAFAVHLIRALHAAGVARALQLSIIEPRATLGAGVAYSSQDPAHRINVPAGRMSLFPDDPTHFARWLARTDEAATDPDLLDADGNPFPRREVFGRYVDAILDDTARSFSPIRHLRERAVWVDRNRGGYRITLESGVVTDADLVVLATSHPPPLLPAQLRALQGHARLLRDPFDEAALQRIRRDHAVLIVGTGLSMADVVASLERRGHRGRIVAISRRGLLSRGHPGGTALPAPFGDFTDRSPRTAGSLLHEIRSTLAAAAAQGIGWHAVLDAVRRDAPQVWASLPHAQRHRVLRHLRPFWDVHRFRVAPQLEAAIARSREEGRLAVHTASLKSVRASGTGFEARIRHRRGGEDILSFDAVVVTTGPAHGAILTELPLVGALARAGLVRADPLGLGVEVDADSRAVGATGTSDPTLLVAGPLARGTVGELMGLPQVTQHTADVAAQASRWIIERAHTAPAPRPRRAAVAAVTAVPTSVS
jgi:uncharacterized NAD(P)/FAD-binding protein YdhS